MYLWLGEARPASYSPLMTRQQGSGGWRKDKRSLAFRGATQMADGIRPDLECLSPALGFG